MKPLYFGFIVLIIIALIAFLLKGNTKQATSTTLSPTVTTAQIVPTQAASVTGTYATMLPGADCEGINVALTLNADKTATKYEEYVGCKEVQKSATLKGTWSQEAGNIVKTIFPEGTTQESGYYKVMSADKLVQLDMEMKPADGELANMYTYTKSTETKFRATEGDNSILAQYMFFGEKGAVQLSLEDGTTFAILPQKEAGAKGATYTDGKTTWSITGEKATLTSSKGVETYTEVQ